MRQLSINNSKIIKLLKENKKVVGDFNKSKASKISKEYIEKYKSLEKELQEIEATKNAKIAEFKEFEAKTETTNAMKAREQLMNKISDISGLIRSELPKLNVEKGEFEEITNAILNEDGKSVTLEIVDKLEEYKESLRNKNVQDKR